MKEDILIRLRKRTKVEGTCWRFMSSLTPPGYARICFEGEHVYVHRLSAHLFHGMDLGNRRIMALHDPLKCKFKNCWNPDHLSIGTGSDNVFQRDALQGIR